jgi:hypothetical protein
VRRRRSGWLVPLTAGLVIAAGIALALVRFFGEVPPGRNPESAVGAAAFGLVIAAPGILAWLSVHDRPVLLLPAAVLLVPLSFLSFALVTLPLLLPAVLLIRAYGRAPGTTEARDVATTMGVLVLLAAALVVLFRHDDPREYSSATATYSTSDVITYSEASLSLGLTALATSLGWRLSRPRAALLPHPASRRPYGR